MTTPSSVVNFRICVSSAKMASSSVTVQLVGSFWKIDNGVHVVWAISRHYVYSGRLQLIISVCHRRVGKSKGGGLCVHAGVGERVWRWMEEKSFNINYFAKAARVCTISRVQVMRFSDRPACPVSRSQSSVSRHALKKGDNQQIQDSLALVLKWG